MRYIYIYTYAEGERAPHTGVCVLVCAHAPMHHECTRAPARASERVRARERGRERVRVGEIQSAQLRSGVRWAHERVYCLPNEGGGHIFSEQGWFACAGTFAGDTKDTYTSIGEHSHTHDAGPAPLANRAAAEMACRVAPTNCHARAQRLLGFA